MLNQLGAYLEAAVGRGETWPRVLQKLCELADVQTASLWLADDEHQVLSRAALHGAGAVCDAWEQYDRQQVEIQIESPRLRIEQLAEGTATDDTAQPTKLISQPIEQGGRLLGVLNFYTERAAEWWLLAERGMGHREFLRAISGQFALFLRTKSLEANSTFYKEVHHRVKNNLQTVVGLLRMQIRRLDQIEPERALQESINRIHSIALVHETLSTATVGMVDANTLLQRICAMHAPDKAGASAITVDVREELTLDSREATTMALVVSELVQNAVQHGGDAEAIAVQVRVTCEEEHMQISVSDNGKGLPPGFDPAASGSLGLTIVHTLVREELQGEFTLDSGSGVTATVRFPLAPQGRTLSLRSPV